jgi:hypothetical protein
MRLFPKRPLAVLRAVALGSALVWAISLLWVPSRLRDQAGVIPRADIRRFNEYLQWIFDESGVDIHMVFLRDAAGESLEARAVRMVEELRIGRRDGTRRGVLLLYDVGGRRLRIEIGYGLESYLPDGFVAYLMREHTADFFASGDLSTGLRLTLRMIHHRIREAALGRDFDPTAIDRIRESDFLSGGGGASVWMAIGRERSRRFTTRLSREEKARYRPQETPGQAYRLYVDWLTAGRFDPQIDLFTTESRGTLAGLPMTRAYFDYMFLMYYGRAYTFDARGDLALLVFTDDPLVSPMFLRRSPDGWQIDIDAEVMNSLEFVGGRFTWGYRDSGDDFGRVFADRIVRVGPVLRIAGGDNRTLPVRGDSRAR